MVDYTVPMLASEFIAFLVIISINVLVVKLSLLALLLVVNIVFVKTVVNQNSFQNSIDSSSSETTKGGVV